MITIVLDDAEYRRMIDWLNAFSDTLPINHHVEIQDVVRELQAGVCQTATVFDGTAFEDFLSRLDEHPAPDEMKALLDKARVKGGDQTPF